MTVPARASGMAEIPVIVGATASGKTRRAVSLAKITGAEIVSADSMQVYRRMDIGTAKATLSEREGVPHHMIDVVEPDERFSVADYKKMASQCVRDILSRGRGVIVTGGTGLYISALVYNINYPAFTVDAAYRERLTRRVEQEGTYGLHAELADADPEAAAKIHINDVKRIIRALEVYKATGMNISAHERLSRAEPPEFNFKLYGIDVARDELYRRINARVDAMFENGLVGEARAMFDRYGYGIAASQAIGYKELIGYFNGACGLDDVKEKIKTETRRYAKRQLTWFRSMKHIEWTDGAAPDGGFI